MLSLPSMGSERAVAPVPTYTVKASGVGRVTAVTYATFHDAACVRTTSP